MPHVELTKKRHHTTFVLFVDCSQGSDLVIALDTSGSIGVKNFQMITMFLDLLINSLAVKGNETDPTASRVGMLTFADSATIHFHLSTYSDRTEILQAINVRYSGGTTNTSDAIR